MQQGALIASMVLREQTPALSPGSITCRPGSPGDSDMSIEYLRSFKISGYAVFDFAASFLGMFLLSPLLSGLARRAGWQVPKVNWVFMAMPLGIAAHLASGKITPMTRDFMDPSGHYPVKAAILVFLFLSLRDIKRIKKD